MPEDKKHLAIYLNNILKEKYGTDIIFGGSLGLYLNGIILDRDFSDIDVKVVGIDPNIPRKDKADFDVPIHFLGNTDIPLEYKEIEIDGEKILVYTVETILNCKKHSISFNKTRKIKNEFTERKIEKDTKDLEYIKEKYGIE